MMVMAVSPLVVCADCAAKCVAKQGKMTDRAQSDAIYHLVFAW
jgi:hypothetical protein